MKIRTIIVDDVKLARTRIRLLIKDGEIEIIAECKNGREAIEAIRNLKPDLVILDIQMPKIDGFEVVETIGAENMPTVIFATAYDEFAVRAFEVNAIDYLLKPFDEERLAKAIARVKREFTKEKPAIGIEEKLRRLLKEVRTEEQYLRRIPVKSSRGTIFVQTGEIDWIGAAGNYLELHTGQKIHLIRESLSKIEQELDPKMFVRIHRSVIVNLDRIKSLHPLFNGDHLIILHDGSELNVSRTYNEKLLSRLLK
jgi:two-component system, LytTR family, response regulator